MSKLGRPIREKYNIGEVSPSGCLILDIRPRPPKINKKTKKPESNGHEYQIRCIVCEDPKNDRWSHNLSKVSRCKPCYTKSQTINLNHESAYKLVYSIVKAGAKKRGHLFFLSLDDFKKIVSQNCYWCGEIPKERSPRASRVPALPTRINGIDRVDNSTGYLKENCVASCKTCNIAKNAQTSHDFLLWIKKTYEYQKTKDEKVILEDIDV